MTEIDALRRHFEMLPNEELIPIVRDHDEERWRPEVFAIVEAILRSRGVSFRDIADPDPAEEMDEVAPPNLVPIARSSDTLEAHANRMALEAGGIKAWISSDYGGVAESSGLGVILQVRPEDFDAAMEILESEPAPSSVFPSEIAGPACPRCGSREVSEEEEICDVPDAPVTSMPASERLRRLCRCLSCGYRWSG